MYETTKPRTLHPWVAAALRAALTFGFVAAFLLPVQLPNAQAATTQTTASGLVAAGAPIRYATPHVYMTFKGGPGHPKRVTAGTWKFRDASGTFIGACADFAHSASRSTGTAPINGRIPGMTQAKSEIALTLAALYGHTKDKEKAAAYALAFWKLQGTKDFNDWWKYAIKKNYVPAKIQKLVKQMLAVTPGPYKASVSTTAVYVGQRSNVLVKVVGKGSKPAPAGLRLSLSITGGALAKTSGTLNSKGQFTTVHTRTSAGAVRIATTVSVPASRKGWLTNAAPKTQRLLGGSFEKISASVNYNKTLGRPAMVASCDTNCEGIATVKFTSQNLSGKMVKWLWRVSGTAVASLYVGAGKTASTTVKLNDGDDVAAEYCYVNVSGGPCVTATVKLSGTEEVICPAWVKLTSTIDCSCDDPTSVKFTFTFVSHKDSPRHYKTEVLLNGSVVQVLYLTNGEKNVAIPVKMGSTDRVTVRFTAYRNSNHTGELRSGTLFDMSNNL